MRLMNAQWAGWWATGAGLALSASVQPLAAATPLVFPADQAIVPLVVGAAFILPALIAGAFAATHQLARTLGPVLGSLLLFALAVGILAYTQPGMLQAVRTSGLLQTIRM